VKLNESHDRPAGGEAALWAGQGWTDPGGNWILSNTFNFYIFLTPAKTTQIEAIGKTVVKGMIFGNNMQHACIQAQDFTKHFEHTKKGDIPRDFPTFTWQSMAKHGSPKPSKPDVRTPSHSMIHARSMAIVHDIMTCDSWFKGDSRW